MQSQGYQDDAHSDFVCKLCKALYGLKQVPKVWSDNVGQYLVTIGFQVSNAYFSLYVKRTDREIVLVVIYVDDLIVTGDSDADIDDVKLLLKQKFEMKNLRELRYLALKLLGSLEGYGCCRGSMVWICCLGMG